MVSPDRSDYRRLQAETPLIVLFKFAEPALFTLVATLSRAPLGEAIEEITWEVVHILDSILAVRKAPDRRLRIREFARKGGHIHMAGKQGIGRHAWLVGELGSSRET
jgi:hypothetical protein